MHLSLIRSIRQLEDQIEERDVSSLPQEELMLSVKLSQEAYRNQIMLNQKLET